MPAAFCSATKPESICGGICSRRATAACHNPIGFDAPTRSCLARYRHTQPCLITHCQGRHPAVTRLIVTTPRSVELSPISACDGHGITLAETASRIVQNSRQQNARKPPALRPLSCRRDRDTTAGGCPVQDPSQSMCQPTAVNRASRHLYTLNSN